MPQRTSHELLQRPRFLVERGCDCARGNSLGEAEPGECEQRISRSVRSSVAASQGPHVGDIAASGDALADVFGVCTRACQVPHDYEVAVASSTDLSRPDRPVVSGSLVPRLCCRKEWCRSVSIDYSRSLGSWPRSQ